MGLRVEGLGLGRLSAISGKTSKQQVIHGTPEGRSPEEKNCCPFGFCPNEGGGGLPKFFVTFSRGAFLANKGVSSLV